MNLTAVFQKDEFGYSAFIEEIEGVNTQGDSFDEAKENLTDALAMIAEIKGINFYRIIKEVLIDQSEAIHQTC